MRLFSHDILHTHCLKPDLFRLRESQHKISVLLCIRGKGLLRAFQPVSCRTLQSHASARQIATLTRPFRCETVQLSEGEKKYKKNRFDRLHNARIAVRIDSCAQCALRGLQCAVQKRPGFAKLPVVLAGQLHRTARVGQSIR